MDEEVLQMAYQQTRYTQKISELERKRISELEYRPSEIFQDKILNFKG